MDLSFAMVTFSSTTRLTWAWARDGGLPQYFGFVDEKHRVPSRAIVLTSKQGVSQLPTYLRLLVRFGQCMLTLH